jgi:hypothetical protein
MEVTQDTQGRIHVALSLGPKTKPVQLKPVAVIAWGLTECEPAPLPGMTYEQYLDVLYPSCMDAARILREEDARCPICDLRIPECECIHSVEELARKFGLTQ